MVDQAILRKDDVVHTKEGGERVQLEERIGCFARVEAGPRSVV